MNRIFPAFAVLAAAIFAGCTGDAVDDGARDLEKGRAAFAARDLKAASEAFAECARKNATNFEARISLALACIELGSPRQADQAAKEAVAIDPSSAEGRLVEGEAAYLVKDYARAKAAFNAVASAQDLPNALRSQALASRAVVELASEGADVARLSLFRAIRVDFKNAAAWYHLGVLSRGTFHFPAAAKDQFEMACRLDPNSARTRETLRTILPSVRDALAHLAADKPGAAKRDPGLAAKLLAEAATLTKKNDTKGALAKYERAHEADPLSYEAAWSCAQALAKSEPAWNSPKPEKGKPVDKAKIAAARAKAVAAHVDRVLATYRAALDAKPSKRDTCITAARYALQNQRAKAACDFLSHALAHFYDSKPVLDLYVEALGKLGTAEGTRKARLYQAYRKEL
ncbi:MAG: hypothetical protein MJ240_12460 [Kiritimatiellae bacterium]|nr:hypothetical protein [Kiritimatiellia bacterium]